MCSPTALAWTSLAMTAVSGGVQAYNQRQQADAAEDIGEYNAAIARSEAADAEARGRVEEDKERRRIQAVQGQQRAQFGASGVELNTGSPADILVDTAMIGETDALTIRGNAQREARRLRQEGNISEFQGQARGRAGRTASFGTVLGTAGKVAGKWKGFKDSGAIGGGS